MTGDAADTAWLPPELNQRQLEEQAKLQASKQLAKEMTANEAHDMNQGGMRKMRRRRDLSAADLVGIAHAVRVQHRFQREVAEEYRVSVALVSRVARKATSDVIKFKFENEEASVEDIRKIKAACRRLLERDGVISSAVQVLNAAQAGHSRKLGLKKVRSVMRDELGLKFKKSRPILARTNCISSRYQRQQSALHLIDALMAGKRVLNIDEASLSETSFIRKGWGERGKTLRPIKRPLGQSLSLIVAVDNFGASYFAAAHGTIDSRVFSTFLQRLALQLDCEDPDWRNDTLLVLDGAKTHRSEETRRAMAALQLPVMIAGPYGFDGMPAETVFSLLKAGELNPWRTATGKR